MSVYRLYIDEVGNAGMRVRDPTDENDRFLSLSGVILSRAHAFSSVVPELEALKREFLQTDPDVSVVIHRADMLSKNWPFAALRDAAVEQEFYDRLLGSLESWEYSVITVVIDKYRHKSLYSVWQAQPYHYCLKVLLERYVMFLQAKRASGDAMVESRQAKDDLRLKDSYARLHHGGTENISDVDFQRRLSSKELKVKPKSANIAGLQLADLVACAAQRGLLTEKGLPVAADQEFDRNVLDILKQMKFHRSGSGRISGYGTKLLP